ncbi:MAG: hypothetical protein HN576_04860 [Bacteriovoracaceae bacterium]|jgi:hypothetical protein|nr:hypothetical protein [Bacteriovoracaceae bacterium]
MKKLIIIEVFLILLLNSCGEGIDIPGKRVNVTFSDTSSLISPLVKNNQTIMASPSLFKMKFIHIYLSESLDSSLGNSGMTSTIFLNEGCPGYVDGLPSAQGLVDGCGDISNINYYDFTNPTTLNSTLNSKGYIVAEGSYRYIRFETCQTQNNTVNNLIWSDGSTTQTIALSGCNVTAEIATPIEISTDTEGCVIVNLAYDVTTLMNTSGSCSSEVDDNGVNCFEQPSFTPSAVAGVINEDGSCVPKT